jgi:hypothetical protein
MAHDCPLAVAHGRKSRVVLQEQRIAQAQRPPVARRQVAPPDRTVPEQQVDQWRAEPLVALPVQQGE